MHVVLMRFNGPGVGLRDSRSWNCSESKDGIRGNSQVYPCLRHDIFWEGLSFCRFGVRSGPGQVVEKRLYSEEDRHTVCIHNHSYHRRSSTLSDTSVAIHNCLADHFKYLRVV